MISARTMPIRSAFCWNSRGTRKLPMMITKTNRLSTDRLFSVMKPAKYSMPCVLSHNVQTPKPNTSAIAM